MIKAEFKTLKKSRYRIEILKKIETKKKKTKIASSFITKS